MKKIVCISDTHAFNWNYMPKLPDGDILLHAGDFSGYGTMLDVAVMSDWCDRQNFKKIFIVPGNHELEMERSPSLTVSTLQSDKTTVLWDTYIEYEGLKIFGTPWQPQFNDWAFNCYEGELEERYGKIPKGLDILMTHCPPYMILDTTQRGDHVGSKALVERLKYVKPKYHVFGHIHGSHGIMKGSGDLEGITFINCSILNELYEPEFKPEVIEI